jgi:hypothetical protein
MARFRVHHAALLALLGVVGGWVAHRGQATRQDPAAVLEALRAAQHPRLPPADAAGATHRDEPESYDPETLYDFIDGAADAYLARGFRRCAAATYSFTSAEGRTFEVAAEVYRFATAAGARAQLEAERPPAARPLPGASDAWWDAGVLLAVGGADYLKLTAYHAGPDVEEALQRLFAAWHEGGEP